MGKINVILKANVEGLGKKDQMVSVSDGYARNFLYPKGLAMEATAKNINDMKDKQIAADAKLAKEKAAAESAKEFLKDKKVTVAVKAGENGKLFGAVATKDVADAIESQLKIQIDKKKVVLDDPIKTTGTHKVEIKLYPGITGELNVEVVSK